MKYAIGLLASTFLLFGADDKKPPEKQNWERMKACAAQAEKVGGSNLQRNHYSRKYERCFALLLFRGDHSSDWELIDAFEGTVLAVRFLDSKPKEPREREACGILDSGVIVDDCKTVLNYIEEHLTR